MKILNEHSKETVQNTILKFGTYLVTALDVLYSISSSVIGSGKDVIKNISLDNTVRPSI